MKEWTKSAVIQLAKQLEQDDGYIDVVRLANKIGISVFVATKNPEFNAEITHVDNNHFKILVNENHPDTRRRFSIAHEISHFILDKPKLVTEKTLSRSAEYKDEEEKRSEEAADSLAAEILMPTESVETYLASQNITKATKFTAEMIVNIAERFHVSKAMAITRLRKLKYTVPYIEFA